MNIFASDSSAVVSAQNLPDILVNKMVLESAQLLTTAHVVSDGSAMTYKKTHENHPSAIWARATTGNYRWLYRHFKALLDEYRYRTGKTHACSKLLRELMLAPLGCTKHEYSDPPKCMPDEHKVICVHQSYRNYLAAKYLGWAARDKPIHVKWTRRGSPSWLPQYHVASTQGRVLTLKRL